jgi:hypothetical protein
VNIWQIIIGMILWYMGLNLDQVNGLVAMKLRARKHPPAAQKIRLFWGIHAGKSRLEGLTRSRGVKLTPFSY